MAADIFQSAINQWRAHTVPLLPGVSDTEITSAFQKLNYPLSDDVRRLYSLVGGFGVSGCVEDEFDDVWSLWRLERVANEHTERHLPFLWFADWLISSHMYCFRYLNPQISAVYLDHNHPNHPPYLIAHSVAEFLEKYLRNPDEVEAFRL